MRQRAWAALVCAVVGHDETRAHGDWINAWTNQHTRRIVHMHGCLRCGALWMHERDAHPWELAPKEPVMRAYSKAEWDALGE